MFDKKYTVQSFNDVLITKLQDYLQQQQKKHVGVKLSLMVYIFGTPSYAKPFLYYNSSKKKR